MKNQRIYLLLLAALLILVLAGCSSAMKAAPQAQEAAPPKIAASTADHTQFDELKKAFKTAPEVTEACLECHTEASKQVMGDIHWTWNYNDEESGEVWGKKGVINNF